MLQEHRKGDEARGIETEMRIRAQTHPHNQSSNSNHNQDSSRKEEAAEAAGDAVEEVATVLEPIRSPALLSSLCHHPYKRRHIGVEEEDVEGEVAGGEEAVQSVPLSE